MWLFALTARYLGSTGDMTSVSCNKSMVHLTFTPAAHCCFADTKLDQVSQKSSKLLQRLSFISEATEQVVETAVP